VLHGAEACYAGSTGVLTHTPQRAVPSCAARLDVAHGGLDGVLRQHAAVQLDRRQAQVLGDVAVLNGEYLRASIAIPYESLTYTHKLCVRLIPASIACSHRSRSQHLGTRAQVGAKRRRSETCAGCANEGRQARTSSMDRPLTHSVATLLDAMADPQPNVLKHESTMLPSPSTCAPRALAHAAAPSLRPSARLSHCQRALICSFITSPHAGAPTRPVPTETSVLSKEPTLRGWS